MKPLQAADMSKAGVLFRPSDAATKQAVEGKTISGVIVATMIRSSSEAAMPAESSALRAAAVASDAVVSPSPAMRRSLIPVRWTIHSSLVSTIFDRSSLVSRFSGRALPVPVRMAPKVLDICSASSSVTLPSIVYRPRFLRLGGDALADDIHDLVVDRTLVQLFADTNRVFNGAGVGAAVADQAVSRHAQQRRAARFPPVVLGVQFLHYRAQLHEQVRIGFLNLRDDRLKKSLGHPLGELQHDVADEAIAHDHVYDALEQV